MNGSIKGINEAQLDKLIITIKDSLDQLTQRFDQLDKVVDTTNTFFNSPAGNNFRTTYTEIRENYDITKNNILTYTDDLDNVKRSYRNFDSNVSNVVSTYNPGSSESK